jgi:predicted enzyme related to lactoylglutathione lyase
MAAPGPDVGSQGEEATMKTGMFCWHDLMSKDPEEAEKFYTALFGWTINPMDLGPMGTYRMLMNGEVGIGGIVPLKAPEEVPSHWIGYVTVDDVDAALERAENLGGQSCVPGTDIPNIGRFGVMTDPAGAVISPFKSIHEEEMPEEESPSPVGSVCWNELLTNDVETARSFYGEIFGWTHAEHDMGEAGTYTMFLEDGKDRAGAMAMPSKAEGARPHWLPYVAVSDVDEAAGRIEELGGAIHCPPTDIPGVGRFAVGADPTGASFAVFRGVPNPL